MLIFFLFIRIQTCKMCKLPTHIIQCLPHRLKHNPLPKPSNLFRSAIDTTSILADTQIFGHLKLPGLHNETLLSSFGREKGEKIWAVASLPAPFGFASHFRNTCHMNLDAWFCFSRGKLAKRTDVLIFQIYWTLLIWRLIRRMRKWKLHSVCILWMYIKLCVNRHENQPKTLGGGDLG